MPPPRTFIADIFESGLDKLGLTTKVAKVTAKVLEDVQQSGKKVKWIAHSQGGAIFAEAMRYSGQSLSANSVSLNAGANNKLVTDRIAEKADVDVRRYYYSRCDPVPNVIGSNGTPASMVASLLAFPMLFTKKSHHTAPMSAWRESH